MTEEKQTWGDKRAGAGRPKGTTKDISIQRKQHKIRAFDDEWALIKEFADIVKTNPERAQRIIHTK